MLVCLCCAVSERKVLEVIQEGATSLEEVTRCTGAGGDCGACRSTVRKMIEEARGDATSCGGRGPSSSIDAAA